MEIMMEVVKNNGVWASLFVFLLIYTLRQTEKREERIMNFLDEMSENFEKLSWNFERLSEDVEDIKRKIDD